MEEYAHNHHLSSGENTSTRKANLLYSSSAGGSSSIGNRHHEFPVNTFHLQPGGSQSDHCFQVPHPTSTTTVKTESNNNNLHLHSPIFHYPLLMRGNIPPSQQGDEVEAIKAKIIAHPHYPNLLQLYMDCQKVGAPPEVVARLAAALQDLEARQRSSVSRSREGCKDPELDQFMEAYCDMLVKYREELRRPIEEAMDFMRRTETQLNMLCEDGPPLSIFSADDKGEEGVGSWEDQDQEDNTSGGETELPGIDPRAEDRELKNHLLKKYSGYLSSLKQELSKKKKKGKLPKEARQKLLSWWELHYKWPYPSESEKAALAESTGLDQKQINNWFINQRKRHWKPSEDMQFMVMDGLQQHTHNATLYMDGHYNMADGHYRFGP